MKSIKETLQKIKEENLGLLEKNIDIAYTLRKLLVWQEEYSHVSWEEFYDSWYYCEKCKNYVEGQCICYAR